MNFEKLKQELSSELLDDSKERYEFTWPDKRKAILNAITPTNKTLRPNREESKDFDTTQNLYIEGDNLEVLKLLQKTYLGKVKMIYIDPPYNTGNDFIYQDNFKQSQDEYNDSSSDYDDDGNRLVSNPSSNGRFHTDWLNMIYPRLKLARNLLTDDGVIFISIDDNEQANLKKVCDEIFGEENFITNLHIELSLTQGMKVGAAQNGAIVKNGEFVITYSKNFNKFKVTELLYDGVKGYDTHFGIYLKESPYEMIPLGQMIQENKELIPYFNKYQLIPSFKSFCSLIEIDKEFASLIYAKYSKKIYQSMMASINIPDYIQTKLKKEKVVLYEKYLLHMTETGVVRQLLPLSSTLGENDDYESYFGRRRIRGDMWKGFYADMMNVAKEGKTEFKNGKKPIRLIMQLIKWGAFDNSIILDFFSGSATTAHAVMKLNAKDNGRRKFIMVQIPDNCENKNDKFKNICEIGINRMIEAGKEIKDESPLTTQNLDVGFRVLKVDSSNMKDVFYKPNEVTGDIFDNAINNIKEDRTGEDLLFQVLLDMGISLSSKIEKKKIKNKEVFYVYAEDEKFLIASFDRTLNDEVVTEIAKEKPQYFVMRDTDDDKVRINFEQIFKAYSPDTTRKVL